MLSPEAQSEDDEDDDDEDVEEDDDDDDDDKNNLGKGEDSELEEGELDSAEEAIKNANKKKNSFPPINPFISFLLLIDK